MLRKQEILLGKGARVESRRGREPRRTALPRGLAFLDFVVMGLVSRLSLANNSDSESFLGVHSLFTQMDAREKDSGRWSDMWCLLLTFPELSGWWWLISSVFLARTSRHKRAHADGYCGAWPGWAASARGLCLSASAWLSLTSKQRKPSD